ncbi:MAG TPA: hypothetical protein VKV23_10410, partial [Acidimicrobiales bacterium]|nr:hypothetical protein [Acidimicrobiales bacterium]
MAVTTQAPGAEPEHHPVAGALTLFAALVLFAGVLFGLTAGIGAIWTAVTTGSRQAAAPSPLAAAAPAAAAVEKVTLKVNPPPLGGVRGPDGQVHDAFVPASFTMHVGRTYEVTVVNYDTMPHTFTSPGLGLNEVIAPGSAAAPKV